MKRLAVIVAFFATPLVHGQTARAPSAKANAEFRQFSTEELEDKIRGGMLGQLLGNLNGLPHEFKYLDQPGNVVSLTPSLPGGARTDDDTDLEWVIVSEIERRRQVFLPPGRVARLWKLHVNRGVWCANRYARGLMELGFEPPDTGSCLINPWSEFNIAGQFCCETYALMAPAMPQTAARIALHYTHTAIDGEPAQATQLFAAMIATAFLTGDLARVIDAGRASVDPRSNVARIVDEVRRLHARRPGDWRATREAIKTQWQVHGGTMRDRNGYELNTASTIAALLYGRGDLVETMRLAFNFGWDCDNNAATAATIIGVIQGARWMNGRGWLIDDVYRNTTRDRMPSDETITRYQDRVIACARLVIAEQGGSVDWNGHDSRYRIRGERPQNIERLATSADRETKCRELRRRMDNLFAGPPADCGRAVYLAICLNEVEHLSKEHPQAWAVGLAELRNKPAVIRNIFDALPQTGAALQEAARGAGLEPPAAAPP
jgi:hypothetical protein